MVAADLDEGKLMTSDPTESVLRIARAKAHAVRRHLASEEAVLAADTEVVLDDRLLSKPVDPDQAREMLRSIRGRVHLVLTAVAIDRHEGREWSAVVSTRVEMRSYSDDEIERYVERGEPFDKAGGYAIQDRLLRPVVRVDGCYLNVVGLPLCAVQRGLETVGIPIELPAPHLVPPCAYCERGARQVGIG